MSTCQFMPNYENIVAVAKNKRPPRLPLYEHIISPVIMEKILNEDFLSGENSDDDEHLDFFFKNYCKFFKEMTYDTVSYELGIVGFCPLHGDGIIGNVAGPIQSRKDFESMDWRGIENDFIAQAQRKFTSLRKQMPAGMKAVGGIGNGVFEISEELVGLEHLSYMRADDPALFADVYQKIGELLLRVWGWLLKKYSDIFCVCRFGDDLGFKTGLLTSPDVVQKNIIPEYRKIIELIHSYRIPFLWHSCGNIFEIMPDVINAGIDAKHSNEDLICPYEKWIDKYAGEIGLLGGIDVDLLCQSPPVEVYQKVIELGVRFRSMSNGYALGSGNSIPDYVPIESYLAMIRAVQEIRRKEEH